MAFPQAHDRISKKRVGIIGGGAAGLACLRVFLQQPDIWEVVAFELRPNIGGVWYREPNEDMAGDRLPSSAIYDSLTTNIPHHIMAFEGFPFPPSTYVFPDASTVLEYLRSYATHFNLLPHIRFNMRVDDCRWNGTQWVFTLSSGGAEKAVEEISFDFAVVANGHYSQPSIPRIPGLDEWAKSDDNRRVSHSLWYREPSAMVGRSVLVIGGGPSGADIGREISRVARVIYHSVNGAERDDLVVPRKRPRVSSFDACGQGGVLYEDGSIDEGVEHVLLATGYELSFPMLSQIKNEPPPKGVDFPEHLHNSGWHLYPLARQTFPIQGEFPPTSMAIIGLPSEVVPFLLFESQAVAAAKVFHEPSCFDLDEEKRLILERRQALIRKTEGNEVSVAKLWRKLPTSDGYALRRQLYELAGVKEWKAAEISHETRRAVLAEWRYIVEKGEPDEWVKDSKTDDDWDRVLQRLLEHSRTRLTY